MMKIATKFIPIISILLIHMVVFPARAQTQDQAIVRAVIFTSSVCSYCQEIVEMQLPLLLQPFGDQLEILVVDTITPEGEQLYKAAIEVFGVPRGTPQIFIGTDMLMGDRIPEQLPALAESYLAQGGVDWPVIPGLADYLEAQPPFESPSETPTQAIATPSTEALPSTTDPTRPVVHILLFWMEGCPHCHEVLDEVLPPLQAQYGTQLDIMLVELVTMEDVNYLYQIAASFSIARERVLVPFLIIGEDVLIGGVQIPKELPGLIETYLQAGGVGPPQLPSPADTADNLMPQASSHPGMRSEGFTLAIVILVLMAAALVYSLVSFATGKTFSLPPWGDWLILVLIVIGIGVAGYLSYVETQAVAAVCGPVGDCNTVQSSSYARLFGVLPVGVLGLLGYLALLASWLARRWLPRLEKFAATSFWGMSVFAVIFSLYLTYLEPFVIKAVCMWCLASAVIVTLLLLLGTPPAVRQFIISDEEA